MKRILMFGDRDWSDKEMINEITVNLIDKYDNDGFMVIAGGARGADEICEEVAKSFGIHVARVDALWDHYGRAAGPIRNNYMLYLEPHEAHGFHDNIAESKGSKNMRDQCTSALIPCYIHTHSKIKLRRS
jgi:hypothetical protein